MYVVDMHCDSLSLVSGERGLVNSYNFSKKHPQLQFCAHFSECGKRPPEVRRAELMRAFNVYLSECDRLGIEKIAGSRDLFSVTDEAVSSALFTVEGGGGLFASSRELDALLRSGLLGVFGLAWDTNELAASAWDENDTGLTEEGRRLVARLSASGVTIDVSHLSDKSFYELFEISPYPHIATHSNFREVCKSRRNLTRDMARKISERGGVVGINLYPGFLSESDAGLSDILRHIDYGLDVLGEDHIGFGFDIDGTDGKYPKGINIDSSIHEQVIDLLLSHYSTTTVEKIAGLNVINFLKSNLI